MRSWIVFTVLLTATIARADGPYVHTDSGITLPETIAGLKRGEVKRVEVRPGEVSFAIPYSGSGTGVEATVFVRRSDPNKATTPKLVVDETLAAVRVMEQQGQYKKLIVYGEPPSAPKTNWARAGFMATTEDGGPIVSLIAATVKNDHIVKARVTGSDPQSEALKRFIPEVQAAVDAAKGK